MLPLPRLAVGTVQPDADLRPILWALVEALQQQGLQLQGFLSRACFAEYHGEATVTGSNRRHLDSWLMSAEVCREILIRGSEGCDLALVEGRFAPPAADRDDAGGSLDTLCGWLDLPRVVVLDVSALADFRPPDPPAQADALLLDRVSDRRRLADLTAHLEGLWGVPVLGSLEVLPGLRAAIDAVPCGTRPPRELSQRLAGHFLHRAQLERMVELASRRGLAWTPPRLFAAVAPPPQVVVALAYDAAMNCYFPDTLDVLESRGATIVDFSPLRDERLPDGTDIVYLGCGHPDVHAAGLSQNHCMRLALREHLCGGGRIYAEGGGLAYLCEQLETADGQLWRMVGIFPAVARLSPTHQPPSPVEVTLDREIWLGRPGGRIRGYRNPHWRLVPAGPLSGCVAEPDQQHVLVGASRAIGSQLQLNFAAQPDVLNNFFQPLLPQPELPDPWSVAS